MTIRAIALLCVALSVSACAKTRGDIANAYGFIRQANALSSRPDDTGPYPSPFAADAKIAKGALLSPAERSAAYQELKATGAATVQSTKAEEARLQALSPY